MRSQWLSALYTERKFAVFCLFLTGLSTPAWAGNEATVLKQLTGAWSISTPDKESGDIETTTIEFNPNGTYSTRLSSKLFGQTKNTANGRYGVSDADKDTFTLKLEVLKADPEMDKSNTVMMAKIRQIDANTLQSEDGKIVRRVK
ncbi:hypothetical protein [Methylophilus aquaticus]|uniref:Lipocalin-like domain-containing protein n=1 Tax=Methylophilus aquaticus TaxID=1971610 RepID=A0ABT9JV98_9PROT|nr:hypothetical protein [Methylophilus aquaticus]MDP8568516.1 hypothetical protein [Methylophilus aquaticus]